MYVITNIFGIFEIVESFFYIRLLCNVCDSHSTFFRLLKEKERRHCVEYFAIRNNCDIIIYKYYLLVPVNKYCVNTIPVFLLQ